MTLARQALEEALAETLRWLEEGTSRTPPLPFATVYDLVAAAQAILDTPPLGWCETHGSPEYDGERCWKAVAITNIQNPCQFATYVRVKVGP